MDTCLHVLMRDERRKEERSKQGQTNNKAKQHSTPKAVTFPKKNELPHVHMYMYVYLLDITKQRCCIEWFVSGLYNYVHFPVVKVSIVCPVWALQLLFTSNIHVYTYYMTVASSIQFSVNSRFYHCLVRGFKSHPWKLLCITFKCYSLFHHCFIN